MADDPNGSNGNNSNSQPTIASVRHNPHGSGNVCGGLTSRGFPCGRPVPPGFTRCYMHGGVVPSAQVKAAEALALLRFPAIEILFRLMEQFEAKTCGTCGYPIGDLKEKRLAAAIARTVLDRTGLGPKSTLEVKQTDGDMDLKMLRDDEKAELITALVALREVKQKIRKRLHDAAFGLTFDEHTHTPNKNVM